MKAMDVVKDISLFSGDFLRTKFVHDLWPVLKQVVESNKNLSQQVRDNKYSLGHRVQLSSLSCVIQLCSSMHFLPAATFKGNFWCR
jgi:hypothetical protein